MPRVSIDEAQRSLRSLLQQLDAGEEIIIDRGDGTEVQLTLRHGEVTPGRGWGADRGKVRMAKDFNNPLPELEPYR